MKKVLKIILVAILSIATVLSVTACANTENGNTKSGLLYKKEKDGVYVIHGYKDDGSNKSEITLDINEDKDDDVIRIKKGAFSGNTTLKKIIVSAEVKEISAGAFENMHALETLEVPFIGKLASADAYYKETASAPADKKAIDSERTIAHFFGTTEYEKGAKVDVKYIKDGSETTITCYMPVTFKNVIINAPATYSIPMDSFNGAINVKTIEIKGDVKAVGERAFKGTGITQITLPASVKNVYEGAFEGCLSLNAVLIAESASDIALGDNAFKGCVKMNYIGKGAIEDKTIDLEKFGTIGVKALDFGRTLLGDAGYIVKNIVTGENVALYFGDTKYAE